MRLSVVIPVYNEQQVLAQSIARVSSFLEVQFPGQYELVIADNASVDETLKIARQLAITLPRVRVLHFPEKGRGRAVKSAWAQSQADILNYMDVDLSADLSA